MAEERKNISLSESEHPTTLSPRAHDLKRKVVGEVSLNRSILRLALPTMAGWYIQIAFSIVDAIWVGKLGPSALAAVGASNFAMWSIFTLGDIFAVGSASIIARRIGEDNYAEATRIAGRIAPSVIIGGLIVVMLGLPTVDKLYNFIGASPEATRYGSDYMNIIMIGVVFIFLTMWEESVFHTNGDAKTPMKIFALALTLNAVITPVLIFGVGPFPRMEVAGAAVGTVFSQFIAAVAGGIILIRRGLLPNKLRGYRFSKDYSVKVMRIGVPSSVSGFIFCLIYIVIAKFTARFGDEPLAALAVGHRLEEMAWVVCAGFYTAAVTVVGQYLGMKERAKAVKSGWRCMQWGLLFTGVFALLYFFAGKWLVLPFNNDPKVLELGAEYLRINAPQLLFMATGIILSGAFTGAGETVIPMLITVPILLLRIPGSLLFAEHWGLGAVGIWYALALTGIIRGVLMMIAYKTGRWTRKEV